MAQLARQGWAARMTMHDGEIDVSAELVERLVAVQFPQLSDLPISAVRSTGTVNAIYRIGEHHCARLPRLQKLAQDLESEWHWLPKLAPHLSLAVPEPVWKGNPTSSYPCSWAIYRWIDGQSYADELVDDERQAAMIIPYYGETNPGSVTMAKRTVEEVLADI